jgi:hypothetical protein
MLILICILAFTLVGCGNNGAIPDITLTFSKALVKVAGWNISGQLGDGTTTERHTPVTVSGL